jgi:CheY-like chemotaxis protein
MINDGIRVLIIDDDEALRNMYLDRMKMEGFEVEMAQNGEKGLARVTEFKPSVILLDIMMPKINGFAVLDILKTTPEYKNIPVIVLSALVQPESKERALKSGAVDYLAKSEALPAEVVAKIKKAVEKYKP